MAGVLVFMESDVSNRKVNWYVDSSVKSNCFTRAEGIFDDVVNSICESIEHAELKCHPFSYLEVDNILPKKTLRQMLNNWPEQQLFSKVESYSSFETSSSRSNVGSRSSILIQDKSVNLTPSNNDLLSTFWSGFADVIRDVRIFRSLIKKMHHPLGQHLDDIGDINKSVPGFRMYLCQDEGECAALGPHIDATRKVMTLVFYVSLSGLVTVNSPKAWGTALYSLPDDDNVAPLVFLKSGKYEVSKEVEFEANKVWIFPNNNSALHGVSGGEAGVVRKTVMCGYWLFDPN